jgi:tetratricopeptide (TPR) repeat protein
MRFLLGWLVAALLLVAAGSPAHAAWHEAKSKHFIIYSDQDLDQLRRFAERLERFDQAVRHVRGMDDPALTDSGRLTIYTLRSEGAVAKLAGAGSGVRGFYAARASGALAFVPRKAGTGSEWDLDAEAIFFHEYAHHLQLQDASVALPAWVIEGFAEFFATAKVEKDGSVIIGSPPQYRAFGIFSEFGLTIEQMLGGTYGRLDDRQTDQLYGRGWLLTHFLSFEPSRKGQLTKYVDGIQSGMGALTSAKAAFGDLRALDRELDRYVRKSLTGVRVDPKALSIGPIKVRPLLAGEAAVMDVRIRSKRGVNRRTAPPVAADARRAAAAFPNDAFVQATLAEAEYDAGNYAAAEAAADRALAANPDHVHALIYKGRARMELAKASPKTADWKEVRGWFAKANRLDTENAEPLMLFYRSYVDSGVPPTKNAVDGLLYAVTLVPQDDGLRVNAVRRLLIEGRLSEAKNLFSPLAFRPHAPEKYRESNARVMAAIAAGDGKTALGVLETAMGLNEEVQAP